MAQMNVILFNPAPRSGWQPHRRVELPLNLLYPATPLVQSGYGVHIIDQYADPRWEEALERALEERPICFGVSCMTGPQILRALAVSRRFKRRYPDVPVVWGGIHASLLPEQTLENADIDIIVMGEGESTFLELVRALENGASFHGIPGIAYKEGGTCRITEQRPFTDLNAQPYLAYPLIQMDLYRRRIFGADHISFNSSRGCTFGCSFCWEPAIHRRKWRAMDPEIVLDHLKRLIRDYGIRGFNFTDDNFFLDLKRARGILEGIVRADLKISLGKLQIRADTVCRLENDFFELLLRAGVKRLNIGVESGSQRVLDLIRKGETVEDIITANRKLTPYPIVPLYLFMMGLPTETPAELAESIRLASRLTSENPKAVKTFNIYTPYPGTQLYERCLELGLKPPARTEDWAHFNYRNIPGSSTWLDAEMRRIINGLDFPLMFLGKGHFVSPYKKMNPLVVALARLYYPIAQFRIRHFYPGFPIESKLVKALGVFGRQD